MRNANWSRNTLTLAGLAFALTLAGTHGQPAWADAAKGKKIFAAKKCGSCHEMSGPKDPLPVAKRSKIKGPPLWFAGSKFQQAWLAGWLQAPKAILRVRYGTVKKGSTKHRAVSAADAKEVAAYLMSLTDKSMKTGKIKAKKMSRRKKFKAEKLFSKKQVCFGCHQFTSRQGKIGGFTGPTMVGAGKRLQGDWVYAFLKDNTRYYPNGRMPVYGDQAFDPFTEKELKLLVQFIGNQ